MSAARWTYSAAWCAATPFILLYLLYRSLRQPEYRQHWAERFGYYRQPVDGRPLIWIHAVSVGETRAAQPLIAQLAKRYPGHALLVTHMTPTGRAVALDVPGVTIARAYLAYDYPGAVARFLGHFRPCLGVLMETELWPNLLAAGRAAQVPMALVNGRLSVRSFERTVRLSALARPAYAGMSAVLAQTEADAARYRALGAPRVEALGNLKFDAELPAAQLALGDSFRGKFAARSVLLCASTRDGEEKLLLDALAASGLAPEILLVIVPRHPQRFEEVAALVREHGLALQRRSDDRDVAPDTRVWLGDSMGEMIAYYRAADVSYVGGGLLPFGTHNLIEACAVGCPVLLGPHTFNFAQAASGAIEAGAALSVANAAELYAVAARLLGDSVERSTRGEAARTFAARHRGATERTVVRLATLIAAPPGSSARAAR